MRAVVRSEVQVRAPAEVVWDYVTDWPRQGEWIPLTRVEVVPAGRPARRADGRAADRAADGVGFRIRARTGLGPLGFWDPMTVTAWEREPDGTARCEVLHTGGLVRGEAEFAVLAEGPETCRFVWWERLDLPGGPVGAAAWRLGGWAVRRGIDRAVRRMGRLAEAAGRA